MSVLNVPKGCAIHSKDWILPPVFQEQNLNVTTPTYMYDLDFEWFGPLPMTIPEELEGY